MLQHTHQPHLGLNRRQQQLRRLLLRLPTAAHPRQLLLLLNLLPQLVALQLQKVVLVQSGVLLRVEHVFHLLPSYILIELVAPMCCSGDLQRLLGCLRLFSFVLCPDLVFVPIGLFHAFGDLQILLPYLFGVQAKFFVFAGLREISLHDLLFFCLVYLRLVFGPHFLLEAIDSSLHLLVPVLLEGQFFPQRQFFLLQKSGQSL